MIIREPQLAEIPPTFADLPLGEQFRVYLSTVKEQGFPHAPMGVIISRHGTAAARKAADLLEEEVDGFDRMDGLKIIQAVQRRGCQLRGTSVELAVRQIADSASQGSEECHFAKLVLKGIEENRVVPLNALDSDFRTRDACP